MSMIWQSAGSCPAQVITEPTGFDLRMDLLDGGQGSLSSTAVGVTLKVDPVCYFQLHKFECANFCDLDICGNCTCSVDFGRTADLSIHWTRTSTTLSISAGAQQVWDGPNPTIDFPYCVTGNSMQLQTPDGAILTLKRALEYGFPTACPIRTLDQCSVGGGCHQGVCTGGTTCMAAPDEAHCTNQQGCNWDATQCGGVAPSTCALTDFDVVPGCFFVDPAAKCTGNAQACSAQQAAACTAMTGCSVASTCSGGPQDCSTATSCSLLIACSGTGQSCTGMTTCEAQPQQAGCNELPGCTWGTEVCKGVAAPCSQLSIPDCPHTSGCSVTTSP